MKNIVLGLTYFIFTLFIGCKSDGKGLQEKLKNTLQNPSQSSAAKVTNNKSIKPGKLEKLTLQNSIPSCPEDSKLRGKAYPQSRKQWCAYMDENKKEVLHGEFRSWHSNGTLNIKTFYEDGEIHGDFKEWYPNEVLKEETQYNYGSKHGKSILYSKEGKKLREANFFQDVLHGPYLEYSKDERPKSKGTYQQSFKHGVWEEYNKNGKIIRKVTYQEDIKNGKATEYHQDGAIKSQGFYEKDQQMGHWIFYDRNGFKLSEGNLLLGKKHGRWLFFDKQGQARRTDYYDQGRKIDSIKTASSSTNMPGGGSFGSKDILGAEPPIVRRKPRHLEKSKKKDRPKPLNREGWQPL